MFDGVHRFVGGEDEAEKNGWKRRGGEEKDAYV